MNTVKQNIGRGGSVCPLNSDVQLRTNPKDRAVRLPGDGAGRVRWRGRGLQEGV